MTTNPLSKTAAFKSAMNTFDDKLDGGNITLAQPSIPNNKDLNKHMVSLSQNCQQIALNYQTSTPQETKLPEPGQS